MAPPPDYRQAATVDARKYGVPVPIFLRQINQESHFDPNAHSSAGADGIAQFIPSTAKSYGLTNTRDPLASLDAAARYDRDLLKQFGTPARMLSAYNSGKPDAYLNPGFAGGQTTNYVRGILAGGNPAAPSSPQPVRQPLAPSLGNAPASFAPPQVDNRRQLLLALASSVGQKSPDYTPLLTQLLARRAAPQAAPSMSQAPPPQAPNAPAPAYHGATGQVLGATQGENAGFLHSLQELAGYEHAPVQINSGYRSTAHQAELYANRASNPNPVAPPGHSLHEQGLAADGTVGGRPLGTLPPAVLAMFGLESVPNDPVHVQVRRR